MTRPLRIELSGGLYHVTSKWDRRGAIYFRDADREAWLSHHPRQPGAAGGALYRGVQLHGMGDRLPVAEAAQAAE